MAKATKAIEDAVTALVFGDLKDIKEVYNSYVSSVNRGVDYINNGYSRDMRIASSMDDPEVAAKCIKEAEEKLEAAKEYIAKYEPALPILITTVRMKTQDLTKKTPKEAWIESSNVQPISGPVGEPILEPKP